MIRLNRTDYIAISIFTLIFTILVFIRIGNTYAPETAYTATTENRDIVLDLGEYADVDYISIFLGNLNTRTLSISGYNVNSSMWDVISGSSVVESVFSWNKLAVSNNLRYLGLVAMDEEAVFNEMIIVRTDGSTIFPVNAAEYPELFDEQDTYTQKSYLNGTMFDEVYHGRTAYEFIQHLPIYETTHPPLGKTIISLGIRLFGMNPFGWRFMPAVFGILMIPLMYLFAKTLFKNTPAACAATLLLVSDCMHYALSRIATIDIFAAFFILLMYYFLYQFFLKDQDGRNYSAYLPLGLCGITMGLAIATKWTGVYGGVGLAVLFFWYLFTHFSRADSKTGFSTIIGFCCLFFVLLPMGIYVLSYLPFRPTAASDNLFLIVYDNVKYMFSYHSDLVAEHYYSTPFYEWPILKMPLLYATDMVSDTLVSSVSCMGNPFVWWSGILCVLYTAFCWVIKKDKRAGFLVISYLAQYVPWFFISRITFIYHYFPASLFMLLMIAYTLNQIYTLPYGKKVVFGYLAAAAAVFLLFFPVVSGFPASKSYELSLRLLKSWILVL